VGFFYAQEDQAGAAIMGKSICTSYYRRGVRITGAVRVWSGDPSGLQIPDVQLEIMIRVPARSSGFFLQ